MFSTFLILFAVVSGSQAYAPPASAYSAAPLGAVSAPITAVATGLASLPASPAIAPSDVITYYVYLPIAMTQPAGCAPIPGVQYGTLTVGGLPPNPPAEQNADFNLAMRGWEITNAYRGLVDYSGGSDSGAPQLHTLYADRRVPAFPAVYRVYDWDWGCNCRGALLDTWPVTLAGMGVAPGEVLYLPDSGYNIGSGYEALVLYASEERITLKYTRDGNVVYGYTIHIENVCVEPSLLALYRAWNSAGRGQLPALRGGQPFGRARGVEIRVAVRDTGSFMDPRSRKDWWQGN
jgi:hypothetical protein